MIHTELNGALICWTQAGQGADPLRHNVGYHVGDDPQRVTDERQALATHLGRPILWMNQTHSTVVRLITLDEDGGLIVDEQPHPAGSDTEVKLRDAGEGSVADGMAGFTGHDLTVVHPDAHLHADGLILDARLARRRATLPLPAIGVMTADCLPVLFADHTGQVVAAVHAGRLGLENGILLRTVERYSNLGIPAANLHALIGPSICGACYEVPEEMATHAQQTLPNVRSTTSWKTPSLDLPNAARTQLLDAGLAGVTIMGECTYENTNYHSYRRDPNAGRQASIITPRMGADQRRAVWE